MKNEKRKRASKIHLEELRVQTFLSELKPEVAFTAKGGENESLDGWCTIISLVTTGPVGSGDSRWPCKSLCSTQPSGGGTPSDTSPWSC